MILYFDNLITNIPLNATGFYSDLDAIRDSCRSYSTKDRYDVTLYTLASYAEIDWDEVVIVYEFGEDMVSRKKEFEKFVKNLWPNAYIFYGRSDNQKKFQEKVRFINKLKGDWVFYAGNNDHPFVAPNKKVLNSCLGEAINLSKKWKYISIIYSHFAEGYNMAGKGNAYHDLVCFRSRVLREDRDCFVSLYYKGYGPSMQIMNKKLINHLVFSKDLGKGTFKRIESLFFHPKMKVNNQILILPKYPLCEHFDGYSHTKTSAVPIPSALIPPLFIPLGFFENNIKIRYGYDDYKNNWININPLNAKYRFEDEKGTDLKISIDDIPLFWKKRISKIDINLNLDENLVREKMKELGKKIRAPFLTSKDKGYNWFIFKRRFLTGGYLPYSVIFFLKKNSLLRKLRKKLNHARWNARNIN